MPLNKWFRAIKLCSDSVLVAGSDDTFHLQLISYRKLMISDGHFPQSCILMLDYTSCFVVAPVWSVISNLGGVWAVAVQSDFVTRRKVIVFTDGFRGCVFKVAGNQLNWNELVPIFKILLLLSGKHWAQKGKYSLVLCQIGIKECLCFV